ncbi:hypothetical protein BJ165DRAFT_1534446 [Panaeolus papilionaceus]|nr:hypothetical protein BJ165DRAFT_1534446 [Panaeolus papilionaceus]
MRDIFTPSSLQATAPVYTPGINAALTPQDPSPASPPIPAPQRPHHLVTYFLTVTVCSGLKTSLDVLYQGPTSYFNDSDSTIMEGIPVAAPHLNHAVILASGSVQIMILALTPGLTAALVYSCRSPDLLSL